MKHGVSWDPEKYSRAVVGKTDLNQVVYNFSQSGYMTDPAYAGKLLGTIKANNLEKYNSIPQIQKPTNLNINTSVVDFLKYHGMDSSRASLALLAKKYGIQPYSGTAAQNISLLAKLKEVIK